MASLFPSFFGSQRTNVFDPFSLDIWDPFEGPIGQCSCLNTRNISFCQWLKNEEVKVERGAKNRRKERNDNWHRIERSSGKFSRRFRLPEKVKMDQVKASMETGVLTVTITTEEKQPEVKAIEISS
uniref:SHSP domain-containing protein n=1 Tax=Populus trichocarpa TaxID=3694 RepID=A0A2K1Z1X6_POPTR